MEMRKNTSLLWNENVWKGFSEEEDRYHLEKERKSIQWRRIKKRVLENFGTFKGLKTIEIGAGRGTISLLFALEGAEVSVLDYSEKAIESSRVFFRRHNINANFITMDALNIDKGFEGKFDVSMSFGTAEHFLGEKRLRFIKSHIDVLREGGITFIAVPNKWNLFYDLWKFLSESFGRWRFGEEYPFSVFEFRKIGRFFGRKFSYEGVYLFESSFNLPGRIRKILGVKRNYSTSGLRNQLGTPFDKYFSRTIIAIAKK